MQNERNVKPDKTGKNKKQAPERSQTVIIPQLSPEVLEQARRAAAEGKSQEQIEKEAVDAAARRAEENRRRAAGTAGTRPQQPEQPARPAGRKTRAEAEAELYQSIHDDHLWLNNPVMVRGLGLAPAVAAATDVDHAIILCVAAILLLTTTRMLAVAVCHLTGNRFRGVIYTYAAAILYIPVYVILYQLFGADLTVLGIYLPLLVVEPAIIKRMESDELESVGEAFRRGVNNTLGFCVALLAVGALRELLGMGSIYGWTVLPSAPLPLAGETAGGFIVVGLIAAVWCAVGNAYVHYKREEVRHLYAERKR